MDPTASSLELHVNVNVLHSETPEATSKMHATERDLTGVGDRIVEQGRL